jgi:hypothetical protein
MREEGDQIKQKNKLNNWDNCRRNDKLKEKNYKNVSGLGANKRCCVEMESGREDI